MRRLGTRIEYRDGRTTPDIILTKVKPGAETRLLTESLSVLRSRPQWNTISETSGDNLEAFRGNMTDENLTHLMKHKLVAFDLPEMRLQTTEYVASYLVP